MTERPYVEIRDISKDYPLPRRYMDVLFHPFRRETVPALRNVSFSMGKGEVLAIVGPNGSGKTSILKILAGLVLPTKGQVWADGREVAGRTVGAGSPIGLAVMDERSFYWRLTGRQNLTFFATLNDLHGERRRQRVGHVVELLDMTSYADRPFKSYSAGMRQKLCLARALLSKPQVLLLDEPTKSLDVSAANMVRKLIRGLLAKELGLTMVLATLSLDDVRSVCDRVLCLRQGRVAARVSPDDRSLISYMGSDDVPHGRVDQPAALPEAP